MKIKKKKQATSAIGWRQEADGSEPYTTKNANAK
jgi:hypothetical protein